MEEPRSPRPSQDKRPGRLASLGQKTGTSALSNLAIFAILPLVLLGGLLAGLIASDVLTLKPSSETVRLSLAPCFWGPLVWLSPARTMWNSALPTAWLQRPSPQGRSPRR